MAASLVTVEQAGAALGVSRSTVWRLIRCGALPSIRRAGRRLVPVAALRTASRRHRGGPIPAFSPDHPIFQLIGAARGGGRAPGARDKHALLDT